MLLFACAKISFQLNYIRRSQMSNNTGMKNSFDFL